MQAAEHNSYGAWLIGFLDLTSAGKARGIQVESPLGEPIDTLWTPGVRYLVRQVPELGGAWARCLPDNLPLFMLLQNPEALAQPPQPEAVLVTSPARFDNTPEPAVPTWAPGLDGVGPSLQGADGELVRWILLDGYVYDIRDDLYGQPGRWPVNEWRPRRWARSLAARLTWRDRDSVRVTSADAAVRTPPQTQGPTLPRLRLHSRSPHRLSPTGLAAQGLSRSCCTSKQTSPMDSATAAAYADASSAMLHRKGK